MARTKKQIEILSKLSKVNNNLRHVLIDIKAENVEEQFDYCTCSQLGQLARNVERLSEQIASIVFQES